MQLKVEIPRFDLLYLRLEDDPRSTPGHSKVLDQIRAIMKLIVSCKYSRFDKKVA